MVGNRNRIAFNPNQNQTAAPPPNQRLGFQEEKDVVATRGLKLKNKQVEKIEQDKAAHAEYMRNFDEMADKTIQYHNEQNARAVKCVSKFMKLSEDKELKQNRGTIAQDVEREIRQGLIQLAIDLNNDENESDNGKGSVVVLSAVTKILLTYRDRINQLEYEIDLLKAENKKKNTDREKLAELEASVKKEISRRDSDHDRIVNLEGKLELLKTDSSSRPAREALDADQRK
jgi:hypothetical protein